MGHDADPKAKNVCSCSENAAGLFDTTKLHLLFSSKDDVDRKAWLKTFGLVTSDDMLPQYRELHLHAGYRPIPSSYSYCMKSGFTSRVDVENKTRYNFSESPIAEVEAGCVHCTPTRIFYPTNETFNFWTHFIFLFVLMNRFWSIADGLQGSIFEAIYVPIIIYAIGTCMMLIGSCIAHVFCSTSHDVRESCWFCDYASITLSSLGSAIVYNNYVCPYECIGVRIPNLMLLLGVAGVVGHAACCYSRRMTSKLRYLLRSSVFVVLYMGSSVPCGIKYISIALSSDGLSNTTLFTEDIRCHLDDDPGENATHFLLVTAFCALTVFFNVSKIPERWFPGTFDIVGHSHQWLHVCIAIAFYFQTFIVEDVVKNVEKYTSTGDVSLEDLHLSYSNTIGVMTVTGLLCFTTSALFSRNI